MFASIAACTIILSNLRHLCKPAYVAVPDAVSCVGDVISGRSGNKQSDALTLTEQTPINNLLNEK